MLVNVKRLKVVASYLEEAGGIRPEKWEKMSQPEREDYIKKHPTSTYAKKENKSIPNKLTPFEIEELQKCIAGDIIEHKDGTIDIDGNIDFNRIADYFDNVFLDKEGKLKIKFGKVTGSFHLPHKSGITSLEGCPNEVGGSFYCWECNKLKTLEGAPKKVWEDFICDDCFRLESLKGAPKEVGGCFSCSQCDSLESLEGSPKKISDSFFCCHCKNLKSLEGSPEEVRGVFNCSYCRSLESIKGCPKKVGSQFNCSNLGVTITPEEVKQ